jgi:hypothetical protein
LIFIFHSSFVIESKFETRFPGIDPEILELIPYTNGQRLLSANLLPISFCIQVGAWSSGYGAKNRYFWTPDINFMSQKIAEYERNIKRRRLGAKQALKDFKVQQIELVTSIREVSSIHPAIADLCLIGNTVQARERNTVRKI